MEHRGDDAIPKVLVNQISNFCSKLNPVKREESLRAPISAKGDYSVN